MNTDKIVLKDYFVKKIFCQNLPDLTDLFDCRIYWSE